MCHKLPERTVILTMDDSIFRMQTTQLGFVRVFGLNTEQKRVA